MSAVARGAPTSALRSSSTVCSLTFCSSSDSAAIRAYQSPLWRQVPHDPSIRGVCARKRYQALSLLACKARGFAPPPPFLSPPSLLNNARCYLLGWSPPVVSAADDVGRPGISDRPNPFSSVVTSFGGHLRMFRTQSMSLYLQNQSEGCRASPCIGVKRPGVGHAYLPRVLL